MQKIFKCTLTLTALMITGCGTVETTDTALNKNTKSHYGVLSNATVNIYALESPKKLLFSEQTTMGDTIDAIGNVDMHTKALEAKKFYQYEVIGGENWDIDKDGIKDATPTPNNKIFKSTYKGQKLHISWWSIQTKGTKQLKDTTN